MKSFGGGWAWKVKFLREEKRNFKIEKFSTYLLALLIRHCLIEEFLELNLTSTKKKFNSLRNGTKWKMELEGKEAEILRK